MLQENDIPPLWRRVLADIQAFSYSAIIAGGALRDLDNGRPIKDVDIFVRSGVNWDKVDELFKGPPLKKQFNGYETDSDVFTAATYFDLDNLTEFNVIELAPGLVPLGRISLHDFGICQIGFDGKDIEVTEDYGNDKFNKSFTLCRCGSPEEAARSHRRWQRLSQKYQGWELKIPMQFADYWQEGSN